MKKSDKLDSCANIFSKKVILNKSERKSVIHALQVEVKKTHKTSYINAEQIYVSEHCGVIEGGDVQIDYLRGGKVTADTLKAGFLDAGEITANHVHIATLASKNTITAHELIEIDSVSGTKNTLIIKTPLDENTLDKLTSIYDRLALFKEELSSLSVKLEEKRAQIEERRKLVEQHKKEIKTTLTGGVMPKVDMLMSVKEFDMYTRDYNMILDVIDGLEKHIKNDEEEFEKMQKDIVIEGKVISRTPWRENNKIIFVLPKYELEYITSKNENISEIFIKYDKNNKFTLEVVKK